MHLNPTVPHKQVKPMIKLVKDGDTNSMDKKNALF